MAKKTKKSAIQPHPSYPNPTIAEAVCELHFALPEGTSWKASLAGELFKRIHNEFPEMEPVMDLGVRFELSPQRIGHSMLPARQRTKFTHKSQQLLLQLGPRIFTVNVLPKYPGWSKMRSEVIKWWEEATKVLKPTKITRIGLRYINRIDNLGKSETPGDWFRASAFVPAGILRSRGAFLSRIESEIDAENRVVVTMAEVKQDDERGIVFDIDRIIQKQVSLSKKTLAASIDSLHEEVWNVFQAAQTDRLITHLKGGKR